MEGVNAQEESEAILMNGFHNLVEWLRDPFGNRRIHERHRNLRVNIVETAVRTQEVTQFLRTESSRDDRRRLRAQSTNAIERAVLGQPNRIVKRRTKP